MSRRAAPKAHSTAALCADVKLMRIAVAPAAGVPWLKT